MAALEKKESRGGGWWGSFWGSAATKKEEGDLALQDLTASFGEDVGANEVGRRPDVDCPTLPRASTRDILGDTGKAWKRTATPFPVKFLSTLPSLLFSGFRAWRLFPHRI